MSDTTGYMIAAYAVTLVTIIGYAIVVIRGHRAALRHLTAQGGIDRPANDSSLPDRSGPADPREVAHV
jgi:TRAP-type mannitol/chloroaromatic compound transport system permease small subunit